MTIGGLGRPPLRIWVWTAAAVALAVVAALLWRGSDAAATDSTTAPPAGVPSGVPAGAVSEAWSVPGGTVPADVVEGGRVLLGSPSGVRGLDPATGEEAWHYNRSNARLCGLTVTDGLAVAVFRTADRCDEAVALDAGTGVRAWTRNVNFRADATLSSTDRIVLASSPTGVVTLDPTGNTIRWRHAPPPGCDLLGSAVGDAGVAVLQECEGAAAPQVRLLDGFDGEVHWTHELSPSTGGTVRLLGADGLVGVLAGDEARLLSSTDGTVLATLPLGPGEAVRQTGTPGAVLVHSDGTLVALDPGTARRLWEQPATGLPGEPAAAGDDAPAPPAVPEADAVVLRDTATGEELDRFAAEDLAPGGVATVVGPAIVLRLPDRVVGYR